MKHIIEATIVRYAFGSMPKAGEVVWSGLFDREAFCQEEKSRALWRLVRIATASDPRAYRLVPTDTYTLKRERKNGAFNGAMETVCTRTLGFDPADKVTRMRYAKRLSRAGRYLSSKSDAYRYYFSLVHEEQGEYCYTLMTKSVSMLTKAERERAVSRLVSARKGVITRTLNRMKHIKETYAATLFPEAYTEDDRYLSLAAYLPQQQARLDAVLEYTPDDIPMFTGTLSEKTLMKIERWLGIPISDKQYSMCMEKSA